MRKALIIFYIITIYVFAEMAWWGWLLMKAEPDRTAMVLGEGAVFLFIVVMGIFQIQKTLKKQAKLQHQQKNFLLSVTHELKSPLASIKLYLQTILKRDLEPEKQKGFITNSLKDIERLDDLVENMLLATKIENRSYTFPQDEFNFSELVEKVVDRLQVHSCSSQTIKACVPPDLYIKGDRFALTSVLTNLIENAIKYSPSCAEVYVTLLEKSGQIVMEVVDHGPGIPDAEKSRIFVKFYRIGNEDTRQTKGTGLGLYIVKKVLDMHHAEIAVKDNQPTGTKFEITFNKPNGN
jgi:two-component system phosphate regulon sensor histidine kinase PhoR